MTTTRRTNELLGVLGGVGPLASAEFMRTIYEHTLGEREQTAPRVVMFSDPSFPDRTETLLTGDEDLLLEPLEAALRGLCSLGASRVVICCVTLHHLLPRLPAELRARVWSLLDVIFESLARSRRRHLLFCTSGSRQLGIFQRHAGWEASQDYLVLPAPRDQTLIHDLIYRVKRNEDIGRLAPELTGLLATYGVNSFIAGCTEIHLLAKYVNAGARGAQERRCLDPLTIIAEEVAKENL
jgi:aspartate racemase